jgi:hypothetical protein
VQQWRESSWRLVHVLNSALHLEMEKPHFPSYSVDYTCKHSGKLLKKEQRFRSSIGQPRFVAIEIGRSTFRSRAQNNGLTRWTGLKYSRMWHVAISQLSKENCCHFQIWKISHKSKIDAAGRRVKEDEAWIWKGEDSDDGVGRSRKGIEEKSWEEMFLCNWGWKKDEACRNDNLKQSQMKRKCRVK